MSVTLTSTITANDRTLTMTGDCSGAVNGELYRIGDEAVRLVGFVKLTGHGGDAVPGDVNMNRWIVQRGEEGTTRAAHSSGVAVTAARSAYTAGTSGLAAPSPFPSAGTTQTVSLLGPFRIHFNDVGLVSPNDNGPLVTSITTGVLFRVMPFVVVPWIGDCDLFINGGVDSDNANIAVGGFRPANTPTGIYAGREMLVKSTDVGAYATWYPRWVLAPTNIGIFASIYEDGPAVTAGSADIFVETLTPA